jgi:hypothetical protein
VRVMDMYTAEDCVSTSMPQISYLVSRDCVCKLAVHGYDKVETSGVTLRHELAITFGSEISHETSVLL